MTFLRSPNSSICFLKRCVFRIGPSERGDLGNWVDLGGKRRLGW